MLEALGQLPIARDITQSRFVTHARQLSKLASSLKGDGSVDIRLALDNVSNQSVLHRVQADINLPRIIVIGDRSAGKVALNHFCSPRPALTTHFQSSLVEAITGVSRQDPPTTYNLITSQIKAPRATGGVGTRYIDRTSSRKGN